MKKMPFLFAVMYAIFFSLGMACLFNLFSIALAVGLDGWGVAKGLPRFIPFCIIVGLLSLIAIYAVFILNKKLFEKVTFSKWTWIVELLCAFVVSIPMIPLWIHLFAFLQKTF